jgi:hypothetical protein
VAASEAASRDQTRHWVVDQLTNERRKIGGNGELNADGPVLLGWGRGNVLDVQVEGQTPQRVANVLYYIPVEMGVHGKVRFSGSLIRSTTVDGDAAIMKQDPSMMFFGLGSLTVSYRPISFSGTLTVDKVLLELGFGTEDQVGANGLPVQPIPESCLKPKTADPRSCPVPQPAQQGDGLPEIEVFDRTGGGTWHRLPHFGQGVSYELSSPLRYVDPATGVLLVRFVNERQDPVNAFLNVSIEGTVE